MCAGFTLFWLLPCLSLHARAPAEDLSARLTAMQTLQGKFTQTLKDESGEVLQQSQGTFKLLRPGYYRWDTQPPYEQQVIGTPKLAWIVDPDLEQANLLKGNQVTGSPAALLGGDTRSLMENYAVEHTLNHSQSTFILIPKKKQTASPFKRIALLFNDAGLNKLTLHDQLNQRTEIAFSETVANKPINQAVFDYQPPENYDVIRNE